MSSHTCWQAIVRHVASAPPRSFGAVSHAVGNQTCCILRLPRRAGHRVKCKQAMVAPPPNAAGEPGVLRLGIGRLAAEITRRIDAAVAGSSCIPCLPAVCQSLAHASQFLD